MAYMTRNAVIKRTEIGMDDHEIFTAYLVLDMGGVFGKFGGYELYSTATRDKNFAGLFFTRVMETVGVTYWDALVGKAVRALVDEERKQVDAIGNIINEIWFHPQKEYCELWGQPESFARGEE